MPAAKEGAGKREGGRKYSAPPTCESRLRQLPGAATCARCRRTKQNAERDVSRAKKQRAESSRSRPARATRGAPAGGHSQRGPSRHAYFCHRGTVSNARQLGIRQSRWKDTSRTLGMSAGHIKLLGCAPTTHHVGSGCALGPPPTASERTRPRGGPRTPDTDWTHDGGNGGKRVEGAGKLSACPADREGERAGGWRGCC